MLYSLIPTILQIKNKRGQTVTDQQGMNRCFEDFYRNIYIAQITILVIMRLMSS